MSLINLYIVAIYCISAANPDKKQVLKVCPATFDGLLPAVRRMIVAEYDKVIGNGNVTNQEDYNEMKFIMEWRNYYSQLKDIVNIPTFNHGSVLVNDPPNATYILGETISGNAMHYFIEIQMFTGKEVAFVFHDS